jgi:hypothetical protein
MSNTWLACLVAILALPAFAPAATAYTALAISDSRAYGYCNNQHSIGAATDCAMEYCQQSATDPQTCAIGLESEPTGHYSLAIGGGAWGVASGETTVEADADALLYCKASNCQIVARWTEGVVRGN